jgi:glycosyltransferase involved in cell wall biosynthesis
VNRILIASILKPVNDPRMYEKFGISISGIDGTEVHIAGFKAAGEKEEVGSGKMEGGSRKWEDGSRKMEGRIVFHPIFDFKRLSWARLFAPWKFFRTLLKVKPKLVIVTTFELLIVTIIYKILFGAVILYDIQENYYRNIAYNKTYPPVIRNILAIYSRSIECISRPFISHFILAERAYEKEFSFSKGKSIVLENKYKESEANNTVLNRAKALPGQPVKLLYSGTISEEYGIFEAIDLAEKLHKTDPDITLSIIGYCIKDQTFAEIIKQIEGKSFISLTGGDSLVKHERILEAIRKADFGLVSYRPNKSTENCIPTRLFEYQAHLLPMIIQENKLWREFCEPAQSALFISYPDADPATLYRQMMQTSFYPNGPAQNIYWSSEEPRLLSLIKKFIS